MSSTLEWLVKHDEFFFWTDSVFALRDTKNALLQVRVSKSKMSLSKEEKYQEENNWFCTVVCLKMTSDALDDLITERLKSELNTWTLETRTYLRSFSKMINAEDKTYVEYLPAQKGGATLAWKINPPKDANIGDAEMSAHIEIMKKILVKCKNPKCKNIQWASNSLECDPEDYWILGKMFMPFGNINSRSPRDADIVSKIDLLKNCRLFDDFDEETLEQLHNARHIMTHGNQRLKSKDKEKFIYWMKKMLQTECLCGSSNVASVCSELERLKEANVQLSPVNIDKFEKLMKELFPYKTYRRDVLLQSAQTAIANFANYTMVELKKANKETEEQLEKIESEKAINKAIGGAVSATAMAGAGVLTGAAAGAIAGSILVGMGAIASAPIAAPAVAIGVVGAGIGWFAGRAGGAVVSLFNKII